MPNNPFGDMEHDIFRTDVVLPQLQTVVLLNSRLEMSVLCILNDCSPKATLNSYLGTTESAALVDSFLDLHAKVVTLVVVSNTHVSVVYKPNVWTESNMHLSAQTNASNHSTKTNDKKQPFKQNAKCQHRRRTSSYDLCWDKQRTLTAMNP